MPSLYRLLFLEAVPTEYLDRIAIPDLVYMDVRLLCDNLEEIEGGEDALRWICDQNGMRWDWNHCDYKQRERLTEKLQELLDHGVFAAINTRWPALAPVFRKVDGQWQLSLDGQRVYAARHRFSFDLERRKREEQQLKAWRERNQPPTPEVLGPATSVDTRPTTLGPHEGGEPGQERNIEQRMAQMRHEGHGPQRHEGQVTMQQLEERTLYKKDPMTGTTRDGVHGGKHQCGRHATKVNSEEAYVRADQHLRGSEEFKRNLEKAEKEGRRSFDVEKSLEEIYGKDYERHVSGIRRGGTNEFPTGKFTGSGPPARTNFKNGTMKGIYRKQNDGSWGTYTLYPNPHKSYY